MYQMLFQPCFVCRKLESMQFLTFSAFVGKSKFKKMRFGSHQVATVQPPLVATKNRLKLWVLYAIIV